MGITIAFSRPYRYNASPLKEQARNSNVKKGFHKNAWLSDE
tara:strand:- start:845 stop:967 length:123 start_codon:yes stop_codon:yes gene_type:complete